MASQSGLATTTCLEGAIPVLSGLPNLLASKELSDFTIRTDRRSIPVHRVVLSLHSTVFAKACNGDFRETSQASIDLLHEQAPCVEAMVHFMYHFDYALPVFESATPNHSIFHVEMAVIADKYDIAALKSAAFIKCKAELPSTSDKAEAFAETVDFAYENIVAVPDICKYLLEFALDNPKVIHDARGHPSLDKVIRKHPDLASDMVYASQRRLKEKDMNEYSRTCPCPECHKLNIWEGDIFSYTTYYCNKCGGAFLGERWGYEAEKRAMAG